MAADEKVPGVLIAFGKGKPESKPADDEESSEESPGALAAKAFWNAAQSKDWTGAFEAFESLVAECDYRSEPKDSGPDDE